MPQSSHRLRDRPGTIYLGHIPPGFFELEMKRFFSQFGRVTRLRLSRSKHTGRSKGYAFIEFELEEVAKVVAETMNNYLFYERLLKCEFLEPERVHPATFYGANRIFTKPIRFEVLRYNKEKNKLQLQRMCSKLLSKPRRLRKKMATHGINYDFPGLVNTSLHFGRQSVDAQQNWEGGDACEGEDDLDGCNLHIVEKINRSNIWRRESMRLHT
uniref:Nucleolar protein interacting with the FHA domain of MKI67 n=1 Tax=Eptatretus burgeri TaxID=7764 RepID=A0A8C4WU40_EPTBU